MKNEIVEVNYISNRSLSMLSMLIKSEANSMQRRGLTVEVQFTQGAGEFFALILGRKSE